MEIEGEAFSGTRESFYQDAPAKKKESAFDTGKYFLEATLLWGDELVSLKHFKMGSKITAGETTKSDVFIPEDFLGAKTYDLLKCEEDKFLVNLESQKVEGDCLLGGKVVTVAELKKKGNLKDRFFLPLDAEDRCRLKFGPFYLLLSMAQLPEKPKTPFLAKFNPSENIYTAISLILHLIFLLLISLVPEEQLKALRDPFKQRSQVYKVIQMADLEKKLQMIEEAKVEEKIAIDEKDRKNMPSSELSTQQVKKAELTSKLTPEEMRERAKKIAMETGMVSALSNQADLLLQLLGAGGTAGTESGIRVIGSKGPGDYYGTLDPFGGTIGGEGGTGGFKGTPGGLGGSSEFGPAKLGMFAELEKGGGGAVDVKFTQGGMKPIVYTGAATVSGGELDKETIRRYIQTKMDQIRWCYQQEVQKLPDLAGQINVTFIIDPSGKVVKPEIKSTTMNNASVENCILERVSKWRFPSPKGGGVVKVSYPFIFRVVK
ncbi:MAG: energy transducer TonB [Deltaproteobacteria bacterium]|nr:energy transducer TonB [Deltaproteobacteria bacterium]